MNPQRALSGVIRLGLLEGQAKGAGEASAQKDACRALLAVFHSQCAHDAVLFTDECVIYRSVHSQNIVFWAKENPHFYEGLERNPPHVMVWAGLSATHVWSFLLSWLCYWIGLPQHA
jgi:hypothetical protein